MSTLMLATFYIVDGCARLRADRLHRRERKDSWAHRLQTWLSKARCRAALPCSDCLGLTVPCVGAACGLEWSASACM